MKANVEWFGHAGHLCVSRWCNFHLTTRVGAYLVSTVGDYRTKDDATRPTDIGVGRLYETVVFRAGKPCSAKGCACGMPEIDGNEIDFEPYNSAKDARDGHLRLVRKYQRKSANA